MKCLHTLRSGSIVGALFMTAAHAWADETDAQPQVHVKPTVSYHAHTQAGGGPAFEVTVTTKASAHGLDLSTPEGIAALQARIQVAAIDVCAELKRRGAPDRREEERCVATVSHDAMARTAKRLAAIN
jgi:UrcA family protein